MNLSSQSTVPQYEAQQYETQQYEVEEYNNDVELNNPYTGKKGLWAPDPDPAFPNPRLQPNVDPLSTPSNFRPLPIDVATQMVQVN